MDGSIDGSWGLKYHDLMDDQTGLSGSRNITRQINLLKITSVT